MQNSHLYSVDGYKETSKLIWDCKFDHGCEVEWNLGVRNIIIWKHILSQSNDINFSINIWYGFRKSGIFLKKLRVQEREDLSSDILQLLNGWQIRHYFMYFKFGIRTANNFFCFCTCAVVLLIPGHHTFFKFQIYSTRYIYISMLLINI